MLFKVIYLLACVYANLLHNRKDFQSVNQETCSGTMNDEIWNKPACSQRVIDWINEQGEVITIPNGAKTIETEYFKGNNIINKVEIPDTVTEIKESAFEGCINLEKIKIPKSVTIIGPSAFYSCTGLLNITIPDNVKFDTIPNNTFQYCTSLQSIFIPKNVKTIGDFAFNYCSNLEELEIENGLKIIGSDAFSSCGKLIKIKIPNSVTSIGQYAFYDCYRLEEVTISNTIKILNDGIFSSCNRLKRITIPDSVTEIGKYQFYSCRSLESVIIPNTVKSIGKYSFYQCSSLKSIKIPDSVKLIDQGLFQECSNLKSVTISKNADAIDVEAFSLCKSLSQIRIPNSVINIGKKAFFSCDNLTDVEISEKVAFIEYDTFQSCGNLVNIAVSKENKMYASKNGILFNKLFTSLIKYPAGKTESTYFIPSTIKSIEAAAFDSCINLESIVIPNSVNIIKQEAFYSCSNLKNINLPDSVTFLGSNAFSKCTSLTNIDLHYSTDIDKSIFPQNEKINCVTVRDSQEEYSIEVQKGICDYCTMNSDVWNNSKCSDKVIEWIDNQGESIKIPEGAECIKANYFKKTKIKFVEIPNTVNSIEGGAFENCINLERIMLPNNIKTIESKTFYNCTNLISISIPFSVTSIGSYAFYNCAKLTSIIIPSSVNSIGSSAFSKCENQNLNIDLLNENLCSMFSGLSEYECITIRNYTYSLTQLLGKYSIDENKSPVIYHGKCDYCTMNYEIWNNGCIEEVQKWIEKQTEIVIPNGTKIIKASYFKEGSGIKKIEIPSTVTSIEEGAFFSCTNLTHIEVSKENKIYESRSGVLFSQMNSITEISSTESEGGSWNLTIIRYPPQKVNDTYILPIDVTAIDSYAFSHCKNLKNITILNNVAKIGSYAFIFCNNLTSIFVSTETINKLKFGVEAFPNTIENITLNVSTDNTLCNFKLDKIECFDTIENERIISITILNDNPSNVTLSLDQVNQKIAVKLFSRNNNLVYPMCTFSMVYIKYKEKEIMLTNYTNVIVSDFYMKNSGLKVIYNSNNAVSIKIKESMIIDGLVYIGCIECKINNTELVLDIDKIKASNINLKENKENTYTLNKIVVYGDNYNNNKTSISIINSKAIVKIKYLKAFGKFGSPDNCIEGNPSIICGGSTQKTRGYCTNHGYAAKTEYPTCGDNTNSFTPSIGRAGGIIDMQIEELDIHEGVKIIADGNYGQYDPFNLNYSISGCGAGGSITINAKKISVPDDIEKTQILITANGGEFINKTTELEYYKEAPVAGGGIIEIRTEHEIIKLNERQIHSSFESNSSCYNGLCGEPKSITPNITSYYRYSCNKISQLSMKKYNKCELTYLGIALITIVSLVVLVLSVVVIILICKCVKKRKSKHKKSKFLIKNQIFQPIGKLIQDEENVKSIFAKKLLELATQYKVKILSKNEQENLKSIMIGSGGQGIAYKTVGSDGTCFCSKLYKLEEDDNGIIQKSILSEIITMIQLTHCRYIIKLFSIYFNNRTCIINTELCNGGTLREGSKELYNRFLNKDITVDQFVLFNVRWARQIADALSNMHEHKMVHRDIKPENIMFLNKIEFPKKGKLTKDIEWITENETRLIDFGISRYYSETLNTLQHKSFSYTLLYAPAEVLTQGNYTDKSDVYSFGCTLAVCLNGGNHPLMNIETKAALDFIISENMPFNRDCKIFKYNKDLTNIMKSIFKNENNRPNMKEVFLKLYDLEVDLIQKSKELQI